MVTGSVRSELVWGQVGPRLASGWYNEKAANVYDTARDTSKIGICHNQVVIASTPNSEIGL